MLHGILNFPKPNTKPHLQWTFKRSSPPQLPFFLCKVLLLSLVSGHGYYRLYVHTLNCDSSAIPE